MLQVRCCVLFDKTLALFDDIQAVIVVLRSGYFLAHSNFPAVQCGVEITRLRALGQSHLMMGLVWPQFRLPLGQLFHSLSSVITILAIISSANSESSDY